jgi:hypothetical protein
MEIKCPNHVGSQRTTGCQVARLRSHPRALTGLFEYNKVFGPSRRKGDMVREIDSTRRAGSPPLCSVCDGRRSQEPIILCSDCVHPHRVHTYCALCNVRLQLTLEEAQALFSHFNLVPLRAGVTLLFHAGCPRCRQDRCGPPKIYVLDDPDPHHDHVA